MAAATAPSIEAWRLGGLDPGSKGGCRGNFLRLSSRSHCPASWARAGWLARSDCGAGAAIADTALSTARLAMRSQTGVLSRQCWSRV